MIKPLNNHCLIEVINEYEDIIGSDRSENVQKGKLVSSDVTRDHLTASAGWDITLHMDEYQKQLTAMTGKVVYWQEYADAGSKFKIEGKDYVLIPFYRLIGVEE